MHERKPSRMYSQFGRAGVSGPEYAGVGSGKLAAVVDEKDYGRSAEAGKEAALPAGVAEEEEQMSRWLVLALAASSSFITTLDGSIVNIGLPAISETFHVGVSGAIEWVIIGYLVIIAAVLLTFGRLADMVGRRPIFLGGLAIFVLGSALCGMAPSLGLLILARLFQGLGGALIFAVNVAMITSAFYNRERNRVEMHLASLKRQKVKVAGETVDFRAGETIHTESSYKYSVESLRALARGVGWLPDGVWTDSQGYFSVQAFTFADEPSGPRRAG